MFPSDESVKALTSKMLREDDSPFYFSIRNFTDKNLIELMQKYLNHVLEIAKFIEESGQENKDKNLEKIKTNLEIFPSDGNIDFLCPGGSIERLGMAEDNLGSIEFHQQIIKKTIEKKATELLEQINQGNKVHIQSFLKSLLSFIRPNESMFRTPDSQIELKKILDFQRTFKEEVFKNIDKELDEYCDDILKSSNYGIIASYIKIFESQLGIKLAFYEFFKQDEECFIGYSDKINSQAFKSKEEIKEIFENKLKEQFPAIYYDDQESQKDTFDYLAELDIYSSESKVFLDPDKMDALLNLLFPSAEEPHNSSQKIKAGLLFLHSLARNFKDSDPVFFLVFLDKMIDR
jgi:hypothetical protein